MFDFVMCLKISGAAIGSSIAVVFKPGGDTWLKLLQRFVIGTVLGVIFAPVFVDSLGWPYRPDYWIAASAVCGLIAYLLLQLLFSKEAVSFVKKRL